MNVHKNARLTPHGRERIVRQVESGQTPMGGPRGKKLKMLKSFCQFWRLSLR